ncbi:rhodanese-like domain-containing protein [Thiorhodospira sibirica]|uniref:rhodanese-like domain-containing protein n=1 Tax=Thiorhodospira sibirica TaxID=154347 RepID=UPI00022C1150|nr:rhodanese-like domain-containing protein [Thiorhodospira sibirica]
MDQYLEFIGNNPVLFALLATVIGLIIFAEVQRLTRKYQNLSPQDAVRSMNQEDAVLLDVRETAELQSGRIANARHIPMSAFKQRIHELEKHKNKLVIVYCQSGARSTQACGMLTKAEFAKVANLRGGITAWQAASLPVSKK